MKNRYAGLLLDSFGAALGIYVAISLSYFALFGIDRTLRWQAFIAFAAVTAGAVLLNNRIMKKYNNSGGGAGYRSSEGGQKYRTSDYVLSLLFFLGSLLLLSII